jgi:hypothetical protein
MIKEVLVAAAIATCLNSSADAKTWKVSGGWVGQDGSIIAGVGFTATHDGTGQYTVTYPDGSFKKAPIFSCTATGINGNVPVCNLYGYFTDGAGGATALFRVFALPSGAAEDNGFQFTEITVK